MTVEGRDDVHELMEEWRTYVVRHALQAASEAARMIDLEVAAVRTRRLVVDWDRQSRRCARVNEAGPQPPVHSAASGGGWILR